MEVSLYPYLTNFICKTLICQQINAYLLIFINLLILVQNKLIASCFLLFTSFPVLIIYPRKKEDIQKIKRAGIVLAPALIKAPLLAIIVVYLITVRNCLLKMKKSFQVVIFLKIRSQLNYMNHRCLYQLQHATHSQVIPE